MITANMWLSLKGIFRKIAPALYRWLHNTWGRHAILVRRVLSLHGNRVCGGPFHGMSYIAEAHGSTILPKIVGSYEEEIQADIELFMNSQFDTIIDIGCAEGYYTVGFALRQPNAQVFACDINPRARTACHRLAKKNGVSERVKLLDYCDAATLESLIRGKTLVFSDCEGYESSLLNPLIAPSLKDSTIVVELHDFLVAGVTETILKSFNPTHHIAIRHYDADSRDPQKFPGLQHLAFQDQMRCLSEARYMVDPAGAIRQIDQSWAIMVPKGHH